MSAEVLANLAGWTVTGPKLAKVVPELKDITLGAEQQKAIAANLIAEPGAEQLAAGVNKFNFDQIKKMYEESVPGYDQMLKTGGDQINSMLKGELPLDVKNEIARSSAAKSFAGGYGGSPMAGAASAESLGLSSLSLIQQGLSASERWLASAQSRLPHLASATDMFITPMQQWQASVEERNAHWNVDWMKNQLAIQPSGLKQAAIGITDWLENIGASAATMGIGGAMGGGGGMGGGSSGGAKSNFANVPTNYFSQNSGFESGNAGDTGAGQMWDYYPTGQI